MISQLLMLTTALLIGSTIFALLIPVALRLGTQGPLDEQVRARSQQLFSRLVKATEGRLPSTFKTRTDKKIAKAGGLQGMTAEALTAVGFMIAAFCALLALLLAFVGGPIIFIVVLPFLGLILPTIWLDDQVKRRHNTILRQLPFHLDLLTLAVEGGIDFTAGIAKMVEKGRPGPIREEFTLMLSQLRVGTARGQALKEMALRVDLPQLTSFLSALIQADKLGMSIGKVLRIQSETVRIERSQRAEKRANEMPVKILFPLVLFVFPTIWIIVMVPIAFQFWFR